MGYDNYFQVRCGHVDDSLREYARYSIENATLAMMAPVKYNASRSSGQKIRLETPCDITRWPFRHKNNMLVTGRPG
jgi:hypothetical protein